MMGARLLVRRRMRTGTARGNKFLARLLWFLVVALFSIDGAAQSSSSILADTTAVSAKGSEGDSSISAVASHASAESAPDAYSAPALPARSIEPAIATRPSPPPRFQLRSALRQSFEYLMMQHAFRVADDPSLRYALSHDPFFHNWFASYKGYNLGRWGDGDDFIVNDVGHPLQGALASRIFLQNSPTGRAAVIGKNREYWTSRLKGMAWAAAFEVQWKIGPLSETSLGNAGGWLYVPNCGFSLSCLNNPEYTKPPTNNTGLSDWILTPVIGTGWIALEDTLDKYVAAKVAEAHPFIGGKILRTALEPSRSFAGLFMGKLPWQWPAPEGHLVQPVAKQPEDPKPEWKTDRRSIGLHYANISLPDTNGNGSSHRAYNGAIGMVYGYRLLPYLFFDSALNFIPDPGSGSRPKMEGLFGAKLGHQGQTWGIFGKVRPGFIYYENAWTGGETPKYDSLSRFALDTGGVVEVYPSRRSTIRFDVGTTLVRYLQDYSNPRLSQIGSLQSTQCYTTQGNFQISSGYTVRF
jgi:hypothetical protein